MTDLVENPVWEGIRQLETTDLALAGSGPGQIMNLQAQAILNRFAYLGTAAGAEKIGVPPYAGMPAQTLADALATVFSSIRSPDGSVVLEALNTGLTANATLTSTAASAEKFRLVGDEGFISGYNNANAVRRGFLRFRPASIEVGADTGNSVTLSTNGVTRVTVADAGVTLTHDSAGIVSLTSNNTSVAAGATIGAQIQMINNPAAAGAGVTGVLGTARTSGAQALTNVIGVTGQAYAQGSAAIQNFYGVRGLLLHQATAGTINIAAALHAQASYVGSGGSYANVYGCRLESMYNATYAPVSWAFYQNGALDRNYFAGRTLIGQLSDNGVDMLQITGNESLAGDLEFIGNARKIMGNWADNTIANRPLVQSNVTNGYTDFTVVPNGTSRIAAFSVFNDAAPLNTSYGQMQVNATSVDFLAARVGTGAFLPMRFLVNNAAVLQLETTGGATFTGDVSVNGGDLLTTATTVTLFNTVATTISMGGAATSVTLGATTGTMTLRNPTIVGANATQAIFNTVATTVNAFGAATAVTMGATTGTFTINNPTLVGTQATQNLYNTVATTVNFAGAATALTIGATTGTMTLRNPTLVGASATQNLFDTVATTINFGGAATTLDIGAATGNTTVHNVLNVANNLKFPATQVASADANTLDDYEEGTWTPTVIGNTTAGTATYSIRVGSYTKVGNIVTIDLALAWTAGTGSGSLRVTGLPFTSAATMVSVGAAIVFGGPTYTVQPNVGVNPGLTILEFTNGTTAGGSQSNAQYAATGTIYASLTYKV